MSAFEDEDEDEDEGTVFCSPFAGTFAGANSPSPIPATFPAHVPSAALAALSARDLAAARLTSLTWLSRAIRRQYSAPDGAIENTPKLFSSAKIGFTSLRLRPIRSEICFSVIASPLGSSRNPRCASFSCIQPSIRIQSP